jgi:hypothetical protein
VLLLAALHSPAGQIAAQVGKFKGVTRVLHANSDKFDGLLPGARSL